MAADVVSVVLVSRGVFLPGPPGAPNAFGLIRSDSPGFQIAFISSARVCRRLTARSGGRDDPQLQPPPPPRPTPC